MDNASWIPAAIGLAGSIGVALLAYRANTHRIVVDDGTSLREDLMKERRELMQEVRAIKAECDARCEALEQKCAVLMAERETLIEQAHAAKLKAAEVEAGLRAHILDCEKRIEDLEKRNGMTK
jgi:chorismate mutase